MNLTDFDFLPDFKNKVKSVSKSVICCNDLNLILKAGPKSSNAFLFRDFLNKLTPPAIIKIMAGNESSTSNKSMLRTAAYLSHSLQSKLCARCASAAN